MSPDGLEDMGPQTDGLHALTRRNCSDGKWSPPPHCAPHLIKLKKWASRGGWSGCGENLFYFLVFIFQSKELNKQWHNLGGNIYKIGIIASSC